MQDEIQSQNTRLGILSAFGILVIWSGFLVFSRAGVQTSLTPGDITMLRFALAGAITVPFLWRWWPRQLPWWGAGLMVLCGPGAVYSMLTYEGLAQTSAAYGGIFTNASLPLFTVLVIVAVTGQWPARAQLVAIGIVVAGGVLFAAPGLMVTSENKAIGVVLLMATAAILSVYTFCLRYWRITPRQALVLINVPNAALILPLWALFLPSGLSGAAPEMIVGQTLFQALGPGFLAVILYALAAEHLGPAATAGFSAAVPATAALLAVPVLGEHLNLVEWTGIGVVTLGLLLLVRARR
ncbi:MAG: DMT family transporter [Pseudomonadota bacterium]